MSHRIAQINELIRSHLGEIFSHLLSLKTGVFITIAKVDTSADLRHAEVHISVFPEQEGEYVKKTLHHEMRGIQKKLNNLLYMKPLPRLSFSIDTTEARADDIEKILLDIKDGA